MKKIILSIMISVIVLTVTAQDSFRYKSQTEFFNKGRQTWSEFKKTSPFSLDDERLSLFYELEVFSDSLNHNTFKKYLKNVSQEQVNMEQTIPMLYFYRDAFEKVLYELKNTKIEKGTTQVWLLYNMGFVVKTPSGSFGVDIDHRLAKKLEPYLDFLCITHNHGDHYNTKLMDKMNKNGKPVLSNFYKKDEAYLSKDSTRYKIGNFTIHTSLTDHLTNIKDFNTVFRIECGEDSGDFSILHCGDSGFNPKRFITVQGPVSMVVLRWGAPIENRILGSGQGQVQADYAVLSHLIELRHRSYPHGQASITKTLEHLPGVDNKNTILPFWGEKMTWKNGVMF